MFVSVLLFYGTCAAVINPQLMRLLDPSDTIGAHLALLLFIAQLNVFWLFGGYYLMLGVFTGVNALMRTPRLAPVTQGQPIALLYVTMNDFQESAALSCVRQTYRPCHVFILDDSLDLACRLSVDAFAREHANDVTVIRRAGREGYKAGSINSALREHIHAYPFFIVVDADSVLPKDFASRLLPYFSLGEDIGWVQGSHAPNKVQKTAFARDLGLGILPLWEVYYPPRNRFGNVIFLGHGGMLRYDVWKEVGGFPEVVSEDLAFSTLAAQHGYRGYFAHDVVSFEDFPAGYRQLRRQQAKYIKGACEYLHREFVPYLRSPRVKWFEKLDVLMSCGSLFMPSFVLAFMIVFCVLVPLLFGTWQPIVLRFSGHKLLTISGLLLPDRFNQLWTWPYFIVTATCTLAPTLGWLCVIARYPRRGTRLFLVSGIPYLSMLIMATAAIFSYLFSRSAVFLVTGDKWGVDPRSFPRGFSPKARVAERIGAEDRITTVSEVVMGVTFTVICVLTLNLSLLPFALALMFGPTLLRTRWDGRYLRPLLFLPFILICCGLLLGGSNVAAAQGTAAMGAFFFYARTGPF
jgi:cellulose synthase/poly-beta-1,6-N-acetylglucosamine synthase-like glycosyltransferase